jgi:hypothetical protein
MAGRAPPFLDGSHPAGQLLPKGVEVVLPPRSARRARQGHFRPPAHAPARCLVRAGTGSGGMGQQPCLSAQRAEGPNQQCSSGLSNSVPLYPPLPLPGSRHPLKTNLALPYTATSRLEGCACYFTLDPQPCPLAGRIECCARTGIDKPKLAIFSGVQPARRVDMRPKMDSPPCPRAGLGSAREQTRGSPRGPYSNLPLPLYQFVFRAARVRTLIWSISRVV